MAVKEYKINNLFTLFVAAFSLAKHHLLISLFFTHNSPSSQYYIAVILTTSI